MDPPDAPVTYRLALPADREPLVDLLVETRSHLGGSRRIPVFRGFLADAVAAGSERPHSLVAVAEREGELVGAALVTIGDPHGYWRGFPRRHPLGAAALAAHRARKLPSRLARRRRARAVDPQGEAPHTNLAAAVADDERLRRPPPEPGVDAPRPADRDDHLACLLYITLRPDVRGRGLSRGLLQEAIRGAGALNMNRLDCSFAPRDPAAARLYLGASFTVYRYPTGYFASLPLTADRTSP